MGWAALALCVGLGCSDGAIPLPEPSHEPLAGGRWLYRTLLRDAGPLDGLGETTVGLPNVPRRELSTEFGLSISLGGDPSTFEWLEVGPGHYRFTETRQITAPAALCDRGWRFEADIPCPTSATVQHDLLRPTEGFVARSSAGGFLVASAGPNASYVADPEAWQLIGGDDIVRAAALRVLAPVADALQRPLKLVEQPARLTIHWLDSAEPRPWAAHIHRAIDPETGEIVAADVFVHAGYARDFGAALSERISQDDGSLPARVAEARARLDYDARTLLVPTDETLARLRRAPVESFEARMNGLNTLPSAVAATLGDAQVSWLLRGEPGAVPAMTPLQGLMRLLRTDVPGQGWQHGDVYPSDATPVDPTSVLAFDSGPDIAAQLTAGLNEHLLLVGVLRALGLEPNLAGTRDTINLPPEYWRSGDLRFASSSVLDALAPEVRGFATVPGVYDVAALRWLYRGEVAVFEGEVPDVVGYDVTALPSFLCGDCSREEVATHLFNRRFVAEAEADPARRVPFLQCTAQEALRADNSDCTIGDVGPSARVDVATRRLRWSLGLQFDSRGVRTRIVPEFIARVQLGVHALRTATKYADFLHRGVGHSSDLYSAAAIGADLGVTMMTIPRPGRYCPWPNQEPTIYLPAQYLSGGCDSSEPIDSTQAQAQRQIELRPGLARPPSVAAEDYDEVRWGPGSSIDRAFVPWLLFAPAGHGRPAAALTDVFTERLEDLFETLATEDLLFLRVQSAEDLGLIWCAAGTTAWPGVLTPRRWTADFEPECTQRSYIIPRLRTPDVRYAMIAAMRLGRLSQQLQIFDMGEPSAMAISWDMLPNGYCEVDDPFEARTYRGVDRDSPACRRISHAQDAVVSWQRSPNPVLRDISIASLDLVRLAVELRP